MPLPEVLRGRLSIPVIGAPMFIISSPELVIAQCRAGIVGSFPALNARGEGAFEEWLKRISSALADSTGGQGQAAPFAVNQIVHTSNNRLEQDVELCVQYRVPIMITSLSKPVGIVDKVHSYGGLVFHDVISVRQAKSALDAGVDGLILVCAGAGGHTGNLNPFAFVDEVRRFYDGPVIVSGAIASGRAILAALSLGADMAYIGTLFIASDEAATGAKHKNMIIESAAQDIVCTDAVTGVPANFLTKSFINLGLDPQQLTSKPGAKLNLSNEGADAKAWKDVWGGGQSVGSVDQLLPAEEWISRLKREFLEARAEILGSG